MFLSHGKGKSEEEVPMDTRLFSKGNGKSVDASFLAQHLHDYLPECSICLNNDFITIDGCVTPCFHGPTCSAQNADWI